MAADLVYVNASQLVLTGVDAMLVANGDSAVLEDASIPQESDSGLFVAIERWPRRRRSWRVSWNYLSAEGIETLFAVNGRKYPFLFIPPRERHYTVTDHWFATGDGSTREYQLARADTTIDADENPVRTTEPTSIYYPIDDDYLELTVNNVAAAFTLGDRGLVTFYTAPGNGLLIRASFHYATPVRFSSETIDISMRDTDIDDVRSATIVEDFEP